MSIENDLSKNEGSNHAPTCINIKQRFVFSLLIQVERVFLLEVHCFKSFTILVDLYIKVIKYNPEFVIYLVTISW
jgi:hypothetical protein